MTGVRAGRSPAAGIAPPRCLPVRRPSLPLPLSLSPSLRCIDPETSHFIVIIIIIIITISNRLTAVPAITVRYTVYEIFGRLIYYPHFHFAIIAAVQIGAKAKAKAN